MQKVPTSPWARDDTLLGVCQALGEDFGFNPLWLRLAFGAALLFHPLAAIGGYVVLAGIIALARWLVPDPVFADVKPREHGRSEAAAGGTPVRPKADNDAEPEGVAAAA